MEKSIMLIDEKVLNEIRDTQIEILKKISTGREKSDDQFINRAAAAAFLGCDEQTITNFEKEGLIRRYGRGKFIRYLISELNAAMGKTA